MSAPVDVFRPAQPPHGRVSRHSVTAVVVACDGARWLPRVLARLDRQTRRPDRIIAVDVGSTDATRRLLAETLGEARILTLPRGTAFGVAVAAALDHVDALDRVDKVTRGAGGGAGSGHAAAVDGVGDDDVVEWVWLLHDDGAPNPDALAHLLDSAGRDPLIGVAGPKIRSWRDRRQLLEVGVTIAGSGRRETGLDRNELDQGQHDGVRDVLAVSTAGMLVRADLLDVVGGFDPNLPAFRDDVDLCWRVHRAGYRVICVTDAVVHHAQAAAAGRRAVDAAGRHGSRAHLLDRRSALYVLLVNRPAWQLPLLVLRLSVGTLVRALGYLVGKLPAYAIDEVRALGWVLARPLTILRARRARARVTTAPYSESARFLPRPTAQARATLESVGAAISARRPPSVRGSAPRTTVVETGPTAEEAEDLEVGNGSVALLRRQLTRPGALLGLGLTVLALLAARELVGTGRLLGGALLPAPGGASDLWRTYSESWHPVGTGSGDAGPPYLAVLAGIAGLLAGSASWAVDVALLGCIPLCGVSAYLAVRPLGFATPLRLWAAATYALLPAATGAVAGGRLTTAIALVLLPPLALALVRGLRSDDARPRAAQWRAVWAAGGLLAVSAALVPLAYVLATVLLVVAALAARTREVLLRSLTVLVVPPLALLPWTFELVTDPRRLVVEPGLLRRGLVEHDVSGLALVLAHPGGPGMYPLVISLGLLGTALAALLRRTRRQAVLIAWTTVLVGVAVGFVVSRVPVSMSVSGSMSGSDGAAGLQAWPGYAVGVSGLGLVVAAAIGGERARERLTGFDFGWRQPLALALAAGAAVTPLVAAGAWLWRGADDPIERSANRVLPEFVAAAADRPDRPRTLVLRPDERGRIAYTLARGAEPTLGDTELTSTPEATARLAGAVSDVASGRGGADADALASFGIRYILLRGGNDSPLVRTLDGVPGLARVGSPEAGVLWQVEAVSSRVRIIASDRLRSEPVAVPSERVGVDTDILAGERNRVVVLAEAADDGWRATLDGRPLPATTVDGWAQGFVVGDSGGRLVIEHRDLMQLALRWLGAAVLGVVLLLALPAIRVSAVDDDDDDELGPA